MKSQAPGVPPELSARLSELQAQSRSPSREDIIEVVEQMMGSLQGDLSEVNLKIYSELEGLAKYILTAKREIAALRPDEITAQHLPTATDELDAIVGATEEATNTILQAMEALGSLTEKMAPEVADQVNETVTQVYEACNFQDITGQRITKVVGTLRQLEERLSRLAEAIGDTHIEAAPEIHRNENGEVVDAKALLHGPQLPQTANAQDDIDAILASFD